MNVVSSKLKPVEYSLPTERSVPSHRLADFSILLYAPGKWGKTTLANQFPKPLFLKTENGTKSVSVFDRWVNKWDDFLAYIKLLERTKDFSTVVIDTADLLYKRCDEAVCRELDIDHVSEEGFAKGYDRIKSEFILACTRITASQRGVIFISHSEEKTIRRMGRETERTVPTMPKGALKIIHPMCDIIAYGHYDETGQRVLQIRGDEDILAGHRLQEHFVGVNEIRMGKSPEEGYANFVAAFMKGTKGGAPQTVAQRRVVVAKK